MLAPNSTASLSILSPPRGFARTKHVPLTEVTPELETQFGNLIRNALLETDRKQTDCGHGC